MLFRVLDNVTDFKQENADNTTGLQSAAASALPEPLKMEEDDLPVYKLKFVIRQTHLRFWKRSYNDIS